MDYIFKRFCTIKSCNVGLLGQLNVVERNDPLQITMSRADEEPVENYKTKDK